jgi:site-specific DNA recombinase
MPMVKGNEKPMLRFVALIRVSTEKQQKQGESLRTQRKQIKQAVESFDGEVVEWFGGQEHATFGFEHREVDRLLEYCERHQVDAVIVAHQDRWSRDNISSELGLNRLQKCGVRFFVLGTEHNLNEPTARLYLAMSSSIGAYHAATQKKKSIESRIERAKQGIPTAGKLPFGRTFNRNAGWGINPTEKAKIESIAERYLAGESLEKIAVEYGINHTSLHKTLMLRSGTEWEIVFEVDGVVVRDEPLVVPVKIPPLLPPETINALQRRAKANKTYSHGAIKNEYLLRRVVFCARCGYAMFGQTNHNGKRYYRHCHNQRAIDCDSPLHSVPADILEETVMLHLWAAFGNVGKLIDAMETAVPNKEKIKDYRTRLMHVTTELRKFTRGRERLLSHLENGTISDEDVVERLAKSKQTISKLATEKDLLEAVLRDTPDENTLRDRAELMASIVSSQKGWESMTRAEKRVMVEMVFGGTTLMNTEREWEEAKLRGEEPTPLEKRMGVYVDWVPGEERKRSKAFSYCISGHLIDQAHRAPLDERDKEFFKDHYYKGTPPHQEKLTNCLSR